MKLEKLLIEECADERTAIEAMRIRTKRTQARDETPEELGARATKLSTLTFPEEVRENVANNPHPDPVCGFVC